MIQMNNSDLKNHCKTGIKRQGNLPVQHVILCPWWMNSCDILQNPCCVTWHQKGFFLLHHWSTSHIPLSSCWSQNNKKEHGKRRKGNHNHGISSQQKWLVAYGWCQGLWLPRNIKVIWLLLHGSASLNGRSHMVKEPVCSFPFLLRMDMDPLESCVGNGSE